MELLGTPLAGPKNALPNLVAGRSPENPQLRLFGGMPTLTAYTNSYACMRGKGRAGELRQTHTHTHTHAPTHQHTHTHTHTHREPQAAAVWGQAYTESTATKKRARACEARTRRGAKNTLTHTHTHTHTPTLKHPAKPPNSRHRWNGKRFWN